MYRVLIVEDDMAIRMFYKMMKTWSECDFSIAGEASDGGKALRLMEKEKFDLVFTDIRMPFVDGVELLKKMRENGDATPVIFASSYSDFEYAQQGIVLGLFDYLLKPVDEKKLESVLLRVKSSLDQQNKAVIDTVMSGILNDLGLSADEDNFVFQIAAYCTAHYKEDLASDDFADLLCLRKDYLGKLFKQHFGISLSEFRLKVKISYAIELLKTGTYKAYEVSEILGFSSYQYFNDRFKAVTGTSPADYKFGNAPKE